MKAAEALGLSKEDVYDQLGSQEPLKIPGVDFAKVEKDFTSHGRIHALDFLSILDHYRGKDKTSLRALVEQGESQKYRLIFIMPEEGLERNPE